MTVTSHPWMTDGPVFHRVLGDDIQTVEFLMRPGDRIVAEPHTFLCAVGGVHGLDVNFGRRARDLFYRRWAGESTILHEVTCANEPARVVMGAPQIGKIVRLPVRNGRSVICQRGAFICATGQVDIGIAFTGRLRAGLFGGQGMVFQRLSGNGDVFLHALGSVTDWVLPEHGMARVSTKNILAFEDTVGYDIQAAAGAMSMLLGLNQTFLSQLEGPGRILVQSLDAEQSPSAPKEPKRRFWQRKPAPAAAAPHP